MSKDSYPQSVAKASLRKLGESKVNADVSDVTKRRAGAKRLGKYVRNAVAVTGVAVAGTAFLGNAIDRSPTVRYQKEQAELLKDKATQSEVNAAVAAFINGKPSSEATSIIKAQGENPNLSLKVGEDQNGQKLIYPDPDPAYKPNQTPPPIDTNVHVK